MDIQEEKKILLKGIQEIEKEIENAEMNAVLFQRYNTLVNCLISLNWRECGEREGEGLHT